MKWKIALVLCLQALGNDVQACPSPLTPEVRDELFNAALAEIRKPLQSGDFSVVRENLACLSDSGDFESTLFMAALHLGNEFGQPDETEAIQLLKQATKSTSGEEVFAVGQAFLFGSVQGRKMKVDVDSAIDAFVSASALGYAKASAELCSIFRTDAYNRKSYRVAIDYCIKAAEQGDRHSEAVAADLLFEYGEYPGDAEQAINLYFSSALFGTNVGPLGLGKAYEQGIGVLQDYMLAHAWYNVASSRLSPDKRKEVSEAMARLEVYLGPAQVIEAQAMAKRILEDMQSFAPRN